jgi:hypothetical protein
MSSTHTVATRGRGGKIYIELKWFIPHLRIWLNYFYGVFSRFEVSDLIIQIKKAEAMAPPAFKRFLLFYGDDIALNVYIS